MYIRKSPHSAAGSLPEKGCEFTGKDSVNQNFAANLMLKRLEVK